MKKNSSNKYDNTSLQLGNCCHQSGVDLSQLTENLVAVLAWAELILPVSEVTRGLR